MRGSRDFLKRFIIGIPGPHFPVLVRKLRESNDISYITEGILDLGLRFYITKEFLSSLQFLFCRKVKTVPSLEEIQDRKRPPWGKSNESRDKEGGHKNERG